MLTKYGTSNIIIMFIFSAVLMAFAYFINTKWLSIILWIAGIMLALFTLWFFRDPKREVPEKVFKNIEYLIAPADGRVVEILTEHEPVYLKTESKRISIFLSPLDVHVNRTPVSGVVEFYKYIPGDYLVAYHPKASEKNEQSRIGVKNKYGKVLFKQLVGIVARRIVCVVKEGDTLRAGDEIGMMKFGSRMDIAVPVDTEIYVKTGDRVIAGETIIGKLNNTRITE